MYKIVYSGISGYNRLRWHIGLTNALSQKVADPALSCLPRVTLKQALAESLTQAYTVEGCLEVLRTFQG